MRDELVERLLAAARELLPECEKCIAAMDKTSLGDDVKALFLEDRRRLLELIALAERATTDKSPILFDELCNKMKDHMDFSTRMMFYCGEVFGKDLNMK